LQLEDQPALFAGGAWLMFARGAVGGRCEGAIAAPAAAALGGGNLLARLGQVAQHMAALAVDDQGTGGHVDNQIVGTSAMAIGRPAGAAALGAPVLLMHDRRQAVGAGHGAEDDVAAVAAVAAVRPAARHVLLAPEAADAA